MLMVVRIVRNLILTIVILVILVKLSWRAPPPDPLKSRPPASGRAQGHGGPRAQGSNFGSKFGSQMLDPKCGLQIWIPTLDPNLGFQIWGPDLGLRFGGGRQIWVLGPWGCGPMSLHRKPSIINFQLKNVGQELLFLKLDLNKKYWPKGPGSVGPWAQGPWAQGP